MPKQMVFYSVPVKVNKEIAFKTKFYTKKEKKSDKNRFSQQMSMIVTTNLND